MSKKEAEATALQSTKQAAHAGGRSTGMSGRDLFTFNQDLLDDESEDEDEGGDGNDRGGEFDIDRFRREQVEMRREMEEERIRKLGEGYEEEEN